MSRTYKKKSLYHTDRKAYYKAHGSADSQESLVDLANQDGEKMVAFTGGDHWSQSSRSTRFGSGSGHFSSSVTNRYPHLTSKGDLFTIKDGYVSVTEIVWLCQKAWQEIQIFRNTIEAMVEFSVSPIHISCENESAKKFCESWLKAVKMYSFSEQFYREMYRSCNIPVNKIYGELSKESLKKISYLVAAKEDKKIPVKYTILNPAQVSLLGGITPSERSYYKALSPYEIRRLANPQSPAERVLLENIDPKIKTQIKKHAAGEGYTTEQLYVELTNVDMIFYQKQDYEYFAIPLFYGVLDDLELKLEMKAADRTVLNSVDNMIMLVTMGGLKIGDGKELPPNESHIKIMRSLFENKKIQRVLVADHTTKIEYIIPDLTKVVGKDKYEQVNQDIREGLQTIFGSDEKFANQMTKVKIFAEKLNKGRVSFEDWLSGQMAEVCQEMGFRVTPKVKLEKINLDDQTQLDRIYTRLCELGILTPDGTLGAINTGILPEPHENEKAQKEYLTKKKDELYYPQIFYNNPTLFDEKAREQAASPKVQKPENPTKENGRPAGSGVPQLGNRKTRVLGDVEVANGISITGLTKIIGEYDGLKKTLQQCLKKQYKASILTEQHLSLVDDIAKSITLNHEPSSWKKVATKAIKAKSVTTNLQNQQQINKIAEEYEISDPIIASFVYYSFRQFPELQN